MASAPTSRGESHAWNHLTISTLERSKAMVTATIRISPNTICCANTLMPTKVMPTRATDSGKAPYTGGAIPSQPPLRRRPADDLGREEGQQELVGQRGRAAAEASGHH